MRLLLPALALMLMACGSSDSDSGQAVVIDYATHDESGKRICGVTRHHPDPSCYYQLKELPDLQGDVAVRVFGLLRWRGAELFVVEASDIDGVEIPITGIGDTVQDWTPDALEGYVIGIRGNYSSITGGIYVDSMGPVDVPGVPRPSLPAPSAR